MRLIGIHGLAGSGKDTCADWLVRERGWVKIALADPMKRFCREVFGFSGDQLWGTSELRNAPDPRWGGLTPRHALQQLGTEWGRACHADVWVRYAIERADDALDHGAAGVVIPDVRYQNEVDAIRQAGGHCIAVVRPTADRDVRWRAHTSEAGGLEGLALTINNDGSLEGLFAELESVSWPC